MIIHIVVVILRSVMAYKRFRRLNKAERRHIDVQLITSIKRDALIKHIKTYLPDRTTKDLRHTFITRCRECKIQREITSVWSGHISDNSMTTKVYTHLESNKELQLEEIALFNYELE